MWHFLHTFHNELSLTYCWGEQLVYYLLGYIYIYRQFFMGFQNIWQLMMPYSIRKSGLVWFGLVSLFNGISTYVGYLMPKLFSQKNRNGTIKNHSWEDKGVHTFPKGICPKVNVILRLEYELANYDSTVHHFNHYTTRTPPKSGLYLYKHKQPPPKSTSSGC